MLWSLLGMAVLSGGGLLWWKKKRLEAPAPGPSGEITSRKVDEFVSLRSDGLLEYNRQTAEGIAGWLGSVSLRQSPVVSGPETPEDEGVEVYDLVPSSDGAPPPVDASAIKLLFAKARAGKLVLVSKNVTITGPEVRRALVVPPGHHLAKKHGGQGAGFALLITPSKEQIKEEQAPMPGFDGTRPVPGALVIPHERQVELPPDLRKQVDELLSRKDADPRVLEAVARQIELGGFPVEAALLLTRATDLRASEVIEDVKKPTTFVIPKGHPGAEALAVALTGDARRYKELLGENPELAVKNTADGTYVVPWVAGQVVRLPPSWLQM